jgi:predicted amidohydrolase YtcJ
MALGTDQEIRALVGRKTETIDLRGNLAIPGFIEGHGHFMGLGDSKLILDLRPADRWQDIVDQVAAAASNAAPGEWIRGRGWHQDKWRETPQPAVEGFPVHQSLSRVSPNNPVMLTHASGHATFVNDRALRLAGINRRTPDPAGGQILKDAAGQPTGLLRETAMGLVSRHRDAGTPESRDAERRKMARLAAQECLSKGITTFQDAGSSFEMIDFLKTLVDEGELPLRLWVMIRESNEELAAKLADYRVLGYGDNMLTVRAIKLSLDGALGSRGAWLLEPYTDAPHLTGLNLVSLDDARVTAELAIQHNYQLGVHAIGDRANREVLDIYEETFAKYPERRDRRWRIEHAQHLHADDIPRFGQLGVVASMQSVHCTSDGPWVPDRLGDERTEVGAYVWQKLMRSGAVVTNGTDAPVEDVSPIASYYSAISRRLNDGTVFYPDQRMSRLEALRSYTINPARAAFEESVKGSLEVGKFADITVLSQDILTIAEQEIPNTEVLYTIVGGNIRYRGGR